MLNLDFIKKSIKVNLIFDIFITSSSLIITGTENFDLVKFEGILTFLIILYFFDSVLKSKKIIVTMILNKSFTLFIFLILLILINIENTIDIYNYSITGDITIFISSETSPLQYIYAYFISESNCMRVI